MTGDMPVGHEILPNALAVTQLSSFMPTTRQGGFRYSDIDKNRSILDIDKIDKYQYVSNIYQYFLIYI
jgi:hypothetical protein